MRALSPLIALIACLLFAPGGAAIAQERCATNYLQKLQNRPKEADLRFEQWLKSRSSVSSQDRKDTKDSKKRNAAYEIPVVVHIIHNGVGHETNIPDEQVISQIRVLNDDFNRTNADASQTPAIFLDAAGSLDVEFVLAKRTPDGLPTNGIVRVQGPKTSWKVSDNYSLKSLSYWPAEDYLNIWVCNLEVYLGYAQFPQSDILDGLENASTNRLTDGVVIAYDVFGSIDEGNFALDPKYNRGRTTTHEVGHFFGLRHISGDDEGTCGNVGDYVDDTPDQASQTYNCPSHPQSSCSQTTMFQNFLDYTNDACMNLFTSGQVARMQTVLENSPRRKSLTLSSGASIPDPVANDLGIKSIVSPLTGECAGEVTPTIEIKNYGSNIINSGQIRLLVDGVAVETKTFNVTLDELDSEIAVFSPVQLDGGFAVFSFEILQSNGGTDGNPTNNSTERAVFVPGTVPTPLVEDFDDDIPGWLSTNPDGLFSWESVTVPGPPENKALKINFYDYEDSEGEIDLIVSPLIDLTDAPTALLLFDVAYARYQSSNDGLRVHILSECNNDVINAPMVYEKSGISLATTGSLNTAFTPTLSQWRTELIDLSDYVGQKIQFAFVGVNDWGNNVFIDNVKLLTDDFVNLSIASVAAPAPVTCMDNIQPRILIKNLGSMVSSFDVRYSVNGVEQIYPVQMAIPGGSESEVVLPVIQLTGGTNDLIFTIENPNGLEDVDPSNNQLSLTSVYTDSKLAVPFRQTFENNLTWTSVSPGGGMKWEVVSVNAGKAAVHEAYNNTVEDSEAWLVTPLLDMSGLDVARLYFDLSYSRRNGVSDVMQVRASTGCDEPFNTVLATYSGAALSGFSRTDPWVPEGPGDWNTKTVDLQSLLGEESVRIAFVVTNRKGNNLYLDNIELFPSADYNRVKVDGNYSVYPNPVLDSDSPSIAFNFPELRDVTIQIVDNLGRIVYTADWKNTLNQVYHLPSDTYQNGLYHVRVITNGRVSSSKLLIAR